MLKTNRLVKNEVLEMAEMVEKLTIAVQSQDRKLERILKHLNVNNESFVMSNSNSINSRNSYASISASGKNTYEGNYGI